MSGIVCRTLIYVFDLPFTGESKLSGNLECPRGVRDFRRPVPLKQLAGPDMGARFGESSRRSW